MIDAVQRACAAAGGGATLARRLGISRAAISQWRRIPADRLVLIEAITGIDRAELRPDLFDRNPTDASAGV